MNNNWKMLIKPLPKTFAVTLVVVLFVGLLVSNPNIWQSNTAMAEIKPSTPVKHLVVIFQENVSFDHYFATYPISINPLGEPVFTYKTNTPSVNGLNYALLFDNPNIVSPFRIPRSNASTCDNDHFYTRLQEAYNGGLMDKFVQTNSVSKGCQPSLTMGYFDGNTVTAMWNYAQHFSMNDNFFASTFGSSTPGAINLISGQTHGATPSQLNVTLGGSNVWYISEETLMNDANPLFDKCSNPATKSFPKTTLNGTNIGDRLNSKNITWGWFQGGFKPTNITSSGGPNCGSAHGNYKGSPVTDYLPHHEPFQYYNSTVNPSHLPPTSISMIGQTDQANHQYDVSDFWDAADSGNLPSVSFIKAPAYQDGHAGYSSPLAEQIFVVETVNHIQKLPEWNDAAIIITYDDSDGWYDHVMPPIVSQSDDPKTDALLGSEGLCGNPDQGQYKDRCGYGPRLPFIVISPYAKVNYVDHHVIDQTSIIKFIEDNWNLDKIGDQSFDEKAGFILDMFDFNSGQKAEKLFLDPTNGTKLS